MTTAASLTTDLVHELERAGVRDVRGDDLTRSLYSTDASLYRVLPRVVVMPHDAAEVAAVLDVCRRTGVPLTSRGAGTSCAGNAVGPGVVLDFSRHMGRVLSVDPAARTAVVEAGTVHATLQRAVRGHGVRFGPDPSSHTRATVGGMIGNNACGNRALGYGRTSDNIAGMVALTAAGDELRLTTGVGGGAPTVSGAPGPVEAVRALTQSHLATIRTELGRFGRQVSGYACEHLLPERGFDLGRALVGSEGTLAVVTEATVTLLSDPAVTSLLVLGFDDIYAAGDVAPLMKQLGAVASEGIDRRIIDVVRARLGDAAVPDLPEGDAWLFVEPVGETVEEVRERTQALIDAVDARSHRVVDDPVEARALWRIREDGAGLSGRTPRDRPGYAGWEDAAVPPESFGAYLREFDRLLEHHGLTGLPYGHFGDGCLHIRIDFDLDRPGGTGRFREFLLESADLVGRFGGSVSGEHGDGRARSELLPRIYSAAALELFAGVKCALDPDNLLNPGVLVDPDPADAYLRVPAAQQVSGLAFGYPADQGDFSQAVHRCTGVGKCRADHAPGAVSVMCPSYLATREEKDSTRGRARALQEMLSPFSAIKDWRSPELHEALDLCLSCKGCASDCPTGIDMATYKAEVLHQTYRGRLRPPSHYALGWLPAWSRMASRSPRLANALMAAPGVARVGMRAAGVDPRRSLPRFAEQTFRGWFAEHGVDASADGSPGKPVVLFVDSFVEHFSPQVGIDAVTVLRAAGYTPIVTGRQVCCGLTWISTGQLDSARRILTKAVRELDPYVVQGIPIVGLEPSCTAALRHDAVDLLQTDAARRVAGGVVTLAELLAADETWTPPDLTGVEVVAQPHCHHASILGWSADAQLLDRAGADVTRLGGCCGLAGNFGVEQGHYEVSVAVAEQQLLPAIRSMSPGAVLLADGFSCRTQADDLADQEGVHLATLLATYLR
ncbi:FAD-binding and (Fe-S)-binding domain-containing protein [Arsenicicoccus sp. oral taxon 190]|uniref:FAD-binding and (Fe-S)-binding domain-containing protein n=1 Tax=Arsenicicoccus sp. oral taxon 190 TaxID=1658671 RepID=UPI00067A0CCF|nr:FAD-binding and (Fe-S)-binding domain-containing protein [Arsenicicoccus sp. oral taxon 190]AKT51571.1 oxidoreductase [Arsenicicoccus sp. oral taxon 190]